MAVFFLCVFIRKVLEGFVLRYELDAEGFLVHPITGKRLCPFSPLPKVD